MATPHPSAHRPLTPARRRFLDLLRDVGFGRVHALALVAGDPVLDPLPRVTRTYKFGGDHARPPLPADPALKRAHLDLFLLFDAIGTGTLDELLVAHGLPLHAERTG